jgi:hypothetical protein
VLHKVANLLRAPRLTRTRMVLALAVALVADGLQLLVGPLGWTFFDEIIDVLAMVLTVWTIGFHILLLPTFIVEVMPLADMLPTWTGCVVAVLALRQREQRGPQPPPVTQRPAPPGP